MRTVAIAASLLLACATSYRSSETELADAGADAATAADAAADLDARTADADAGPSGDAGRDALPDAGPATVLNFDDRADGNLATNYGALTWEPDWYVYHAVMADYRAHSGTQFVTNNAQPGQISFSFRAPVTFGGAWFSLDPARTAHVRFDVFDAGNVKLGSSATLTQQLTPTYLPVNISNVSKVTVVFDVDFAMDDVTFTP